MDNPLDEALNDDFVRIISASPLLLEAFRGLPDDQRNVVMARWNDLQWQTILAAANAQGEPDGYPKELPLQFEFGQDLPSHYGFVRLVQPLENLHEYAITPMYNGITGDVVSYGLIHRSRVYGPELIKKCLQAEAKTGDGPTPAE
jgi:hypothetical protein